MSPAKSPPAAGTAVARPRGSMLVQLLELAKTPEERASAWAMAERHQQNQVLAEQQQFITEQASWGAKVAPALRVEICRWALSAGADPVDEVDVLGGKPYLKANFWQRLVAADPTFQRAEETWVHDDPRADDKTREERRRLRVEWAIPDEIKATVGTFKEARQRAESKPPIPVLAAVLVTLHFSDRGPFTGKKWSPSRATDDVGMDHPEASALTRAWRKAAMQAVRRDAPFAAKLAHLIDEHRAQPPTEVQVPARPPVVGLDAGAGEQLGQIAPPSEPPAPEGEAPTDDAKPKTVKHNPNAICPEDDWHPRTECKLKDADA